jgi:hypothetical protein
MSCSVAGAVVGHPPWQRRDQRHLLARQLGPVSYWEAVGAHLVGALFAAAGSGVLAGHRAAVGPYLMIVRECLGVSTEQVGVRRTEN